jgi:hypothetical protein
MSVALRLEQIFLENSRMKFKKKYLVPCAFLAVASGFVARAQQAQQDQPAGDTEQVKIDRRYADMLQMAKDMLAYDPKVLTRPIILTIEVGSRTDIYTLDKDRIFTRQPDASKNTLRISAEVPIFRQCGIGFSYKGAEPTVVSELSIHGDPPVLDDTLTIPERGSVPLTMDMDSHKNFVFPDGSQVALESLEQETIKEGLKGAVENFNNMLQNIGYKIDLNNALIEDSRDPSQQTQDAQADDGNFCAKIRKDIKNSKLKQNSDSTINPFGSIRGQDVTDSSWSITYNAYTITISVIPTQVPTQN